MGAVDFTTGAFTAQSPGTTQVTVTDWLGQTATVELTIPNFGLDTTFGSGGYSFYSLPNSNPSFLSVAGDTALVIGADAGDFKGFGVQLSNPSIWSALFTFDRIPALEFSGGAVDSAGNIFSVGHLIPNPEKWIVSKMATTGVADTSFGITPSAGSGYTILAPVPGDYYLLPAAAPQSGGKTVLAGYRFDGTDFFLDVLRLDNAGAIDSSFTASSNLLGGLVVGTDTRPAIAMGSDGAFAVAVTGMPANQRMRIYRFSESGGSPSVGTSPTALVFAADAVPKDLLLEADGKVVVFGDGCTTSKNFCGAKLNTDGTLDTAFGTLGRWNNHLDIPGQDNLLFDADRLLDNRFVLVGQIIEGTGGEADDLIIAILRADGTSISHLRVNVPAANGKPDSARSVFVLPDGRFLVAGTDGDRWFLARFWP